MTDRELLEAAASAMGERVPPRFYPDGSAVLLSGLRWNPLADDGDALRLAVKLHLTVKVARDHVKIGWPGCERWSGESAPTPGELPAATRRAIVRAAASLATAAKGE